MKTYKFNNATVYVEGEVNKKRLKEATVRFFRNMYKSELCKEADRL